MVILALTVASHSCPQFSPIHQIFWVAFLLVMVCGVVVPFRVGCHCAAISGWVVARSLNPVRSLRLEQKGHSGVVPVCLSFVSNSCSLSHNHQFFWLVTAVGVGVMFRVGCHLTYDGVGVMVDMVNVFSFHLFYHFLFIGGVFVGLII